MLLYMNKENYNEDFAGYGSLRNCSTADEWFKILDERGNEETCPEG